MRAIFVQISGLMGVVTFLSNLLNNASVERTIFVSLAVGLGVYFTLKVGDNIIQQILQKTVPPAPEEAKVKDETLASKSKNTSTAGTA